MRRLALLLLTLTSACGDPAPSATEPPPPPAAEAHAAPPAVPAKAPTAPPTVAATLEGFRASMERFVGLCAGEDAAAARAAARALLLPAPRAWFAATFPADKVADLAADYTRHEATIDDLPGVVRHHLAEGLGRIAVERFDEPGDEMATGFQAYALQLMTAPTPLYSLRLVNDEAESGWHLWSFVHADGRFRFVGPLWTLTPLVVDEQVRLRSSMRVRDARALKDGR